MQFLLEFVVFSYCVLLLYFGWDLLSVAKEYQLLIYSGAMIAMMLVLPNGVLSLLDKKGGGK